MTARGKRLCRTHVNGVTPGYPRFFVPGCERCEEKALADPSLRHAPNTEQAGEIFRRGIFVTASHALRESKAKGKKIRNVLDCAQK